MINAAIIGLGRWGQNLVECVQGKSERLRFTTGVARTREKARAFAEVHGIALVDGYAAALADAKVDAIILATPHTQHAEQVVAAARADAAAETPAGCALLGSYCMKAAFECAPGLRRWRD